MPDWRKKAKISADVVYFDYGRSNIKDAEEMYIWDLDKTYLDTRFESLQGILTTAFERPVDKKNVPGTKALVRSLKKAWKNKNEKMDLPIYFITASPPQMERKILEKLGFDGVQPCGLFCKDNLKNLRPRRLWRLKKQLGYKLQALLELRLHLGEDVRQIMWGDDSESDVMVYCLYSDICARRLKEDEIRKILRAFFVVGNQMAKIFDLQSQIPIHDPVEKIYINLAEDTDSEYYLKFGRRVLASYNTFQTSLDLFQDGRLSVEHVVAVAQDMMVNYNFTNDELEKSFDDLIRRSAIGVPCVEKILPALQSQGLIHAQYKPSIAPKEINEQVDERVYSLDGSFDPWVPDHIDYLYDYR